MKGGVLIVDLGTQYVQLIARVVREMNVYSRITVPERVLFLVQEMQPKAIILSGGPCSVFEEDAPQVPKELLDCGVPILGICFGMQWLVQSLGGSVESHDMRQGEYGHAHLTVSVPSCPLFTGVSATTDVWMSHGDEARTLPAGMEAVASSAECAIAAMQMPSRGFYGLQFHPEVEHSADGDRMLRNFIVDVAGCATNWEPGSIVDDKVASIRALVGDEGEVVMGLSGGVDSSVAAVLIHRAIGNRLHCVFVDNGLLRAGEREGVESLFRDVYHMDLTVVDATRLFLDALAGVTEPERKRKIIGAKFVEVFKEQAKRYENAHFLGQGTLYPDVIESVSAHGGKTATIKSHHNVGGLPKDLNMTLVEPLRDLFKDEVREIGLKKLDMPEQLIMRQPFPGPGLAIRVLGEVTDDKLRMVRAADAIVREEVEACGANKKLWQYFATLLSIRSVGVQGDQRTYQDAVGLRIVSSRDAMTADWEILDRPVMKRISGRIINTVRGVNRVFLDVSQKPPSTIELE